MATIKCKFCNKTFTDVERYVAHIEQTHEDMIPPDMTAYQFYYFLKTGKSSGICMICKKNTNWNPNTNKYNRLCTNPACKERYVQMFKDRMIGKFGKTTLLRDPEHQKKMLANRKISGKYRWSDGTMFNYTGSYELAFLEFLDEIMEYDSKDIIAPSPHTYYYEYEGEKHFYIPDFFIPSLNLEIEIKDGGSNPNTHHKIVDVDKVKEALKDEVMKSNIKSFNYLKIVDKDHTRFFDYLMLTKKQFFDGTEKPIYMV